MDALAERQRLGSQFLRKPVEEPFVNKPEQAISLPEIVSQAEWQKAIGAHRVKEKAATRARDALAAERRRLPMVKIEKRYEFTAPNGKVTLLELFEGRRQLIVHHFMYALGVTGWPTSACPGCSMFADQVGHLAHLHARNTSYCLISRAPIANIEQYKKRMGWDIPWVSSEGTDFNRDVGVTTDKGESFALSVFLRDGDSVYRTYYTNGRGVEALGSVWTFLDLTPLGRQETWEDTPPGRPQTPAYRWWRLHDEYQEVRS
jgi:predicted dithiol-disulfide oxidoreductase (DUF899 family)